MICDVSIHSASYGPHVVVEEVDFSLDKGDILAIVGESGSGKTTVARIITGLNVFYGLEYDGRVELNGVVDMIPQNITDSLDPLFRIEDQLLELNNDINAIQDILKRVGFDDIERILKAYPHNLSGGMRQRVLIAMALLRANIVVADEFTSALDSITKLKIVRLIERLNKEDGITVIFITHDMELLDFDGEMMVMFSGLVVEKGRIRSIKENPYHPYTQFLLKATPRLNMHYSRDRFDGLKIDESLGCPFYSSCPKSSDICKSKRPPLKEVDGRFVRCHF
ncbi:oligopeptide/dipeptide ABC transporter ATP-binding protein [Hippea sp. KM1]|uniref:oligopeptide/dipeptide ABC transporter ATP-binding protein n=1 Tax=Hippea sp. KM1 TaxID=944481 RepID=UPI00046D58F4|nr:ABC transporter ATP-binding protein [Hippea sp. KM1]